MKTVPKRVVPGLLVACGVALAAPPGEVPVSRGADYVSAPAVPDSFFLDARTRPVVPAWRPGDPIREIPRQFHGEEELQRNRPEPAHPVVEGIDVLAQLQRAHGPGDRGGDFTTPLVNQDGASFSGVFPPDISGDAGGGFFVEVYNGSGGALLRIYDSADGTLVAGPFSMDGLGSGGACASGLGDGVVLFDPLAQRWLFTEFSGASNTLCTYVSSGDDPVVTTWTRYAFNTPGFPDYPKYGVWSDAYYIGANEGPAVYAIDRTRMLAGQSATLQRKAVPGLPGLGFEMTPPVSVFGATPPPAGAPGIFIRSNDDERNYPATNDPTQDFLQLFTLSVDFTTPANTVLAGPVSVAEAEWNSLFSVPGGFGAIHQPGTSQLLDPLFEVPMVPVHYRNLGDHEVLVGNHVTRLPDDTTNNIAGVRWFELRRTGGPANPWLMHQQGTYAPADAGGQISRWMAAIGMDESGNIAMGYSVARDPGVFAGLRYVGREATDAPGVMSTAETTLVDGASAQTGADRWGDYFGMGVDPVDGCTFWFAGMYMPPGGSWRNRVAAFRFDSCGTPTFTMVADNLSQGVCAMTPSAVALAPVTLQVEPRNGFTDPVDMSFIPGLPAGFSGSYSVDPVSPPGSTVANLFVDDSATPGTTSLILRGSAAGIDRDVELQVAVATATAATASLLTPPDGANSVPAQPMFSWSAAAQAANYLIEIATDAAFTNVILSQVVTTTNFQPTAALPLNTELWWRVIASNECGESSSTTSSFITQAGPGQCSIGTAPQALFEDDVESGGNGWTHEAVLGTDSWTLSTARPNSPVTSWKASDPSSVSDQRLVSPVIAIPDTLSGLNLQFSHWPLIEGSTSGSGATCQDGAILEISLDGGVYNQVPAAQMPVGAYNGLIAGGSGNPLAGNPAWCGLASAHAPVIVDLSTYAGHDARFRFRIATNNTNPREGWYIDDIRVVGCGDLAGDTIFADGFEAGTP